MFMEEGAQFCPNKYWFPWGTYPNVTVHRSRKLQIYLIKIGFQLSNVSIGDKMNLDAKGMHFEDDILPTSSPL